jgi:hypothetical protein
MYIRIIDNKPKSYSITQLRRDYPTISFPKDISPEMLASYDVYPLKTTPQPDHNPLTELVRLLDPVQINGQWQQQWETIELPVSQQIENLRNARAEAYRTESDPLFFKAQRGEAELNEWENKVQEIKDRYQYPII